MIRHPSTVHFVELDHAEFKKWFHYNRKTGEFTRLLKSNPSTKLGLIDFKGRSNLRPIITYKGRPILAHRAAWFYVHGVMPDYGYEVTWINGDLFDLRLKNLKCVTISENRGGTKPPSTNKTGVRGVHRSPKDGKFVMTLQHQNKTYKQLGFKTLEEAAAVRRKLERELGVTT